MAPSTNPLISHGHPGNRFLMSHLGENFASKGYVAVSIGRVHVSRTAILGYSVGGYGVVSVVGGGYRPEALPGGLSAYANSRYKLKAKMGERAIDSEGLATYLLLPPAAPVRGRGTTPRSAPLPLEDSRQLRSWELDRRRRDDPRRAHFGHHRPRESDVGVPYGIRSAATVHPGLDRFREHLPWGALTMSLGCLAERPRGQRVSPWGGS